jgi:hypothetical protein
MRLIGFVAAAGVFASAQADTFDFAATIDGIQSGTGSPATGTLTGVYDDVANSFSFGWNITDELIGDPALPGSHIHNAPAGSNGPIVFGFNNPDGTWPLSGNAVWTGIDPGLVDELFAGNLYVNFHTTQFPGGEVRGQILLVPAPAGAALLGLGGLATIRRRR